MIHPPYDPVQEAATMDGAEMDIRELYDPFAFPLGGQVLDSDVYVMHARVLCVHEPIQYDEQCDCRAQADGKSGGARHVQQAQT